MKKITFRFVYNRKKRLNSNGKALIQIEAYLEKRKAYFSTRIYIEPQYWDDKKKRVVKHPHRDELNRFLHSMLLEMERKELELWKKGVTLDLKSFKHYMKALKTEHFSFFDESRKWVEQSDRKESTRRNLLTTLELLAVIAPSLTFQDINYDFLNRFEYFLRNKGYCPNTIAKHLKQLKTIVNEGIRRGYLTTSPFLNYRIKTVESKHTFLLPDEIRTLELCRDKTPIKFHHVLDAFLFCCYTGLRYSDFIRISSANIVTMNRYHWLVFRSQKTSAEIRLPLSLLFGGKALSILYRYKDWNDFFCLPPNPTVNKILEKIRKLVHLNKHCSFHTARHTNATLLIYSGVNITTVQKLLGHRNIKTTQIYSDVFPETVIEDLKRHKYDETTKDQ